MRLYVGDLLGSPRCVDCDNPAQMVLDLGRTEVSICHACAEKLMFDAVDAVRDYKKRMGLMTSNEGKH